jgi:hypothetical protein
MKLPIGLLDRSNGHMMSQERMWQEVVMDYCKLLISQFRWSKYYKCLHTEITVCVPWLIKESYGQAMAQAVAELLQAGR